MNWNLQDRNQKAGNESEGLNKSQTLIQEAYQKIKQMILDQKFVPGQRLINKDLGELLHMSRTPIINALNRLVQDGFVGCENFRGFYVKPIDIQEVWDAFGVREALEVYAVGQAIIKGDEQDMILLEDKLRRHREYTPHYYTRKKFLLDSEFHLQIAEMAKNRVLKWLLKRNFEHIFLRTRLDNYDPGRMATSAKEHQELVQRMKMKDILGGVEILRNHIQRARDQVINILSIEEAGESGDLFEAGGSHD
ncbi:MAG: GntR family transcriptional regulator [Deltaproteobacteria bacterium]|nr:GntR family transcriptional regulator [Deltaproteobacteria bacterium]MBW2138156.1 GntR family transcriptional regulator [Deltaproteobacteria bacterium]